MSCAAHQFNHRRTGGRVLCFQCYRSRLDRPERVRVLVMPFPRVLTRPEVEHRQRMLAHLAMRS